MYLTEYWVIQSSRSWVFFYQKGEGHPTANGHVEEVVFIEPTQTFSGVTEATSLSHCLHLLWL